MNTLHPSEPSLAQLFEKQAEKHPDRSAIIFHGRSVSYASLNRAANRIAHQLRTLGVGADDIVALAAQRDPALLVGMLAVLKAGGCYMPMDPAAPEARLRDMLQDSRPKAALVAGMSLPVLSPAETIPVIDLRDISIDDSDPCSAEANPSQINTPADLAYCLYTSGTTGKVKGVLVEHRCVINFCLSETLFLASMRSAPEPRILSTSIYCFDIFVTESLLPLLNGWTILLTDTEEQRDIAQLSQLATSQHATILQTTPTKMRMYMASAKHCGYLAGLSTIILCGEPFPPELYTQLRRYTQAHIINAYGPTETTVYMTETMLFSNNIHIGKPIPNTQVYILEGMERCSVGIPGELCVSGLCVARGYLRREALTATSFIPNPFGEGRLYRTGDLARWRPDGTIECLGRIDNQVKIRGIRVEPGEIESMLRCQPGVSNAVVAVKNDDAGEPALYGYVTADDPRNTLDMDTLRAALEQELPAYMIPQRLKQLDHIPMTSNGKTDKKALPDIGASGSAAFVAPSSSEEKIVAYIFKETLSAASIGIYDNFFTLGGHSLRVTQAANMLEELTGVRLPLRTWFDTPTVRGIAAALKAARELAPAAAEIPRARPQPWYPMSPAQRRLYLTCQAMGPNTAYNMPVAVELSGAIDAESMKNAVRVLLYRHAALRTRFYIDDTTSFRQQVAPPEHIPLPLEWGALSATDTPESLLDTFVRPFDLSLAPLLRIKATVGQDRCVLLFDMHHIISDAVTADLLLHEFSQLYLAKALPPAGVPYIDWSEWARERDLSSQQAFWTDLFRDPPPALDLITDHARPKRHCLAGAAAHQRIAAPLRSQIEAFARERGGTPFMVLLAALMSLLSKYSRHNDITVGCPVSNRLHSGCEHTVGMFVNMLPLRGRPETDKPFWLFFDEVSHLCLQGMENQEYPYEELIDTLSLHRDQSHNPLFDVTLSLEHQPVIPESCCGLTCTRVARGRPEAKFELTFTITEDNSGYAIELIYGTALFLPESTQRLLRHFVTLLQTAVTEPSRTIGQLPLMDAAEYEHVVHLFSGAARIGPTPDPEPPRQTFLSLFEAQAAAHPGHTALTLVGQDISYSELNKRANAVAHWLISSGVGREDIVAIVSGRGLGYATGALGTLKAGAAFLPLDASTPPERIGFILQDSGAKALLLADAQLPLSIEQPMLDLAHTADLADGDQNPKPDITPNTLAYCIYTSGTTGTPKGTLLEHRGLVNLAAYFADELSITSSDTVLQFASCAFDASIMELIMALACGAALRLLPEGADQDPDILRDHLRQCTIALLPPQLIPAIKPQGLRILLTGGSAASPETVRLAQTANQTYINAYGPTETSICATVWPHTRAETIPAAIPIGKPLPGAQVYILAQDIPCAIGVPGELCISGSGVGRGYLNSPQLTGEKFSALPCFPGRGNPPSETTIGEKRMYRTGDLARWRPDGNIEYLGRLDDQVKIRGYRIETGEIEALIASFPGVLETSVAAVTRGTETIDGTDMSLIGYIAAPPELDLSALRRSLAQSLPEYMIPPHFILLDTLPKTISGKIDKRALPLPSDLPNTGESAFPKNREESLVVHVFKEILGIGNISVEDSFFALGGDSIKAIRIVSRLREAGYSISVHDIMEQRTATAIAATLHQSCGNIGDQNPVEGAVALTPIQQAFFAQRHTHPHHYNQALAIYSEKRLDKTSLQMALTAIAQHHDMLRAVYPHNTQTVLPADLARIPLSITDLRGQNLSLSDCAAMNTRLQSDCNLTQGPLMRAALYQRDDGDHLLLIAHHLIIDTFSWYIIAEDLLSAYHQTQSGHTPLLPVKTSSFREWSLALQTYTVSGRLDEELSYWQKEIDAASCENMASAAAAAITKPATQQLHGHAQIRISSDVVERLLFETDQAYETEINDLLLCALALAVRRWTGRKQVSVELESHGRVPLPQLNLDRTVGWFTCCYPITVPSAETIEESILMVKKKLRHIPGHGLGYSLLLARGDFGPALLRPLFSFNYMGDEDNGAASAFGSDMYWSSLPTGDMISEQNQLNNDINISGGIRRGELSFAVTYNASKWSAAAITAFCEAYETTLKEVVAHCAGTQSNDNRFGLNDSETEALSALLAGGRL